MTDSHCQRIFYLIPRVDQALTALLLSVLSLAAAPALAQVPSNVYRPPADNFNRGRQQVTQNFQQGQTYQQGQIYQQGQTFQRVPQYQTVPRVQEYYYPQQNQTPVYQQPTQTVPGQVVPQQGQVVPAQNSSENVELKRSLVKARDLIQKYQVKLEDVTRSNNELESEISTLRQSGDMSNSNASQELVAAKAAAAEAQQQMSGLNEQLQNALRNLQTSSGDLDRQKQMGAELQQQIVELQKAARMAAGSDEQVTMLTKNVQQFQTKNDELSSTVTALQNALREKETQIASMGSNDDSQLADVRELLEESETTNRDLSLRLRKAEAEASEMTAPQADPALDQLREDNQQLGQQNQQLGQQNQQLESQNSQLNGMLERLKSENIELDQTVTRLSNMPAPQEAMGFAAASPAATPSPDLSAGLRDQLAAATSQNGQLTRQLKKSESEYASLTDEYALLTDENAQLMKQDDSESSVEVAAAPLAVASIEPDVAPVAMPELGLSSVSAGWPVKYWIFGMLGVGLAVGLGVAWYESVVDPKGLRRSTNSATNTASN